MSIRARLLMLVLGAALLPAVFMGWRYYQDRAEDVEVAKGALAVSARTIASNLDAKIQGTAQLHFGLAQARVLGDRNKAACSQFLSEVREKNPQYTGILTIDPDGSLYCDSLRTGRSLDLNDRGYFKRALDTTGSIVIEPAFGRLTGQAVLQIAYPVHDDYQQLQFVLLASLDLDKFLKQQTRDLPSGSDVVLVDTQGHRAGVVVDTRQRRQGGAFDRRIRAVSLCRGQGRRHQGAGRRQRRHHGVDGGGDSGDRRRQSLRHRRPRKIRAGRGAEPAADRRHGRAGGVLDPSDCRRVAAGRTRDPIADQPDRRHGRTDGGRRSRRADSAALSQGRTRQADVAAEQRRGFARAPTLRHRKPQRKTVVLATPGRTGEAAARYRDQQHHSGIGAGRRRGADRRLQPSIYRDVRLVAGGGEAGRDLPRADGASPGRTDRSRATSKRCVRLFWARSPRASRAAAS